MSEVSNWSWRSPSRNRKFTLKSEAEYNKIQFIWQPIAESGGLLLEMQGKNDVFGLAPQFLSFDCKWICLLCIGVGWRFFTASFIVNGNISYSFISHPKHNALCPNPTSVFSAQSLRVMLVIELWSKTNWTRNFKVGSRISYFHDSLRDIPKRVCKTKKPKCRIILLIFQPSHDQGKMGTCTFNAKCS